MKKAITFQMPLWLFLFVVIVLVVGICTWVYLAQRNPDQVFLSDLTVENIQSVTFHHTINGYKELNEDQIREMVTLLSQVKLPGDSWSFSIIGGGSSYIIYTKDGRSHGFTVTAITDYYLYCIDRHKYLLCEREKTPPVLYTQIEDLMEKHFTELWPEGIHLPR